MGKKRQTWTRRLPHAVITGEDSPVRRRGVLTLRQQAEDLEGMYAEARVRLPPDQGIAQLIEATKRYANAWEKDQADAMSYSDFFAALHLGRVVDATLGLRGHPQAKKYLRKLASGSLDFFERLNPMDNPEDEKRITAKNFLWELEVWTMLRERGLPAELEEPDVRVQLGKFNIGFACKKVYSQENVRNSLRKATRQIAQRRDFGIAAYNLDERIRGGGLWRQRDIRLARAMLEAENEKFLAENQQLFAECMLSSGIIAAFVYCTCVADIRGAKPQFNNVYAADFWTISGLDSQPRRAVEKLRAALMDL